MALSFALEDDVFHMVCEEDFDLEDLRTTFFAIAESHGSKEILRIMVDDQASRFRPSASDLRNISRIWTEAYSEHPARIALVVAREIHFGMGRMLGAFADDSPIDFEVFRGCAEALVWLKTDPAIG